MKKMFQILTVCIVLVMAAGCASYTQQETVEMSKSEVHYIVRAIHPIGTAEVIEEQAAYCMGNSPEWEAADSTDRERLLEIGRERMRKLGDTHEQFSAMDVGVFIAYITYAYVPKGIVRVGDEVVFKMVPMSEAWNGVTCPIRAGADSVLAVDRIVKHHTGSLLYSNGKFIDDVK